MKNILIKRTVALLVFIFGTVIQIQGLKAEPVQLINFSAIDSNTFWRALTDRVHGGQSTAFMNVSTDGTAALSGVLALNENGAGFSSYRASKMDGGVWSLKENANININAKGDGRTYRVLLSEVAPEKPCPSNRVKDAEKDMKYGYYPHGNYQS